MSRSISLSGKSIVLVSVLALTLAGTAASATVERRSPTTYYACVAHGSHSVTMSTRTAHCPAGSRRISWNQRGEPGADGAPGPKGDQGDQGVQGIQGIQGIQGDQGPAGITGEIRGTKSLTLNAPGFVSLFSVHLTGKETAGGVVNYTVRADDGGTQLATEHGRIQWLATANSVTCSIDATDKLHLGTVNGGCTPGFFNPGSQPGVSIFDNVSFSSPAPIVHHTVDFTIVNDSNADIRVEP